MVVSLTSSLCVSMENIVMGKDSLIEFRDREAFERIWGLFLRVPMSIAPTDG
jgi:hypothetical protein